MGTDSLDGKHEMNENMANERCHNQSPFKKLKRVSGLMTLSSSNKKPLTLKNTTKNRSVTFEFSLNRGYIKRDSFGQFLVNIFQYILYDKNAIPVPIPCLEKLQNLLLAEQSISKNKRNALSTFNRLGLMFEFISHLMAQIELDFGSMALCLGDSVRFAKEIFVVNFEQMNLYPARNDTEKLRFLTLRYMIDTFYRRLLNEIPEENPPEKSKQAPLTSCRSIFFAAKINTEQIKLMEQLTKKYSDKNSTEFEEKNFHLNLSNHGRRLGSVMTNTTQFKLDHLAEVPVQDFDVYLDNEHIQEVIDEKLAFDQSNIQIGNESTDSNNQSEDQLIATHTKDELESPDVQFGPACFTWIQFGPAIQCVSKL